MPWRTSPCASVRPSTIPGQIPAAEPTRATIAASHAIMRRIWPGVAATARSSAISRSRCWIERPSVLATTNIAMNIASPPNAAVTGIRVVRVCCELGVLALPAGAPVSTCAPPSGGAHAVDVEAGPGEHADRVDSPGMAGQRASPRRRSGRSPLCWETGWRGRATPTTVTVRARLGRRERQPRAERGGIAGDDLVGPGGRASGAQHVRRQRGAPPPMGDGGAVAEPGRAPTRRRSRPGRRARLPAER